MRTRWRLAKKADVLDVGSRMRQADIDEGWAMLGVEPLDWLTHFDPQRTWVIYNSHNDNVALAGTNPIDDDTAMIWMVATDDLEKHSIEFLKHSRPFIEEITAPYALTFNWVHAANEVHLKWLKWCGFTFIQKHEVFGARGEPFYTFCRIT